MFLATVYFEFVDTCCCISALCGFEDLQADIAGFGGWDCVGDEAFFIVGFIDECGPIGVIFTCLYLERPRVKAFALSTFTCEFELESIKRRGLLKIHDQPVKANGNDKDPETMMTTI